MASEEGLVGPLQSATVAAAGCDGGGGGAKKPQHQQRKMFDEEVDGYETYEEYLDSLVSEEDHHYLDDEEMARCIAELGYRSSGDTLTRENFYKTKARLAEKRMLTRKSPSDFEDSVDAMSNSGAVDGDVATKNASAALISALRKRAKDLTSGELHTLVFLRTRLPRKSKNKTFGGGGGGGARKEFIDKWDRTGAEVSGHIDLCQRFQNENLLSYLSGAKRLVPKMRDLTFYNWAIGKADFRSSANFEVVFEPPSKLFIKHRASSAMIDVSKSGFGGGHDTERHRGYSEKSTDDGKTLNGYDMSGWIKVASESTDGNRASAETEGEEDFVFIHDFRKTSR